MGARYPSAESKDLHLSPRRPYRPRAALLSLLLLTACHPPREDPQTTVILIENSPNSLDPRLGTDAMAERIGALLFDPLVRKDEHFAMQPALALDWAQPDPLTLTFHLRPGVRFSNNQPLEAEDAAYTLRSLTDGSLTTSKSGAFQSIASIDTPAPLTLTLHLKHPDNSLLFNLSDGLFGVVPRNSPRDFAQHPIGSGPFRFVSAQQDRDVILARNPTYWGGPPHLEKLRFAIVPDAVTVALELKKGSADIAANELTLDLVHSLEGTRGLATEAGPGSPVMYLNFNVSTGPLADARVRQAIACAMDRQEIVDAVWRGQARLAATLLPAEHWAAAAPADLPQYPHDPARAQALLQSAGYPARANGTRLALEMKTSTDETTRLLALILQQQLAAAGIHLSLRSSEFGTFYSDVTAGRFQIYALRWIGSNEDPDIFHYALGSDRTPPKGGNRGHYRNPQYDALLAQAANTTDQPTRRSLYLQAQQILAHDLPAIPLWYPNNQVVHTTRIQNIHPTEDGSFAFLREATQQ